ncbi:MAG: phage holin family protein [Microcoleaceae cyanobacterium]
MVDSARFGFLITWSLTAVALFVTAALVPGIQMVHWQSVLVAVVVMGLINALVRPVLIVLTLPLTLITLGLFLPIINAVLFLLVGWLTPGLMITGFWSAMAGSIVLSIVSGAIDRIVQQIWPHYTSAHCSQTPKNSRV